MFNTIRVAFYLAVRQLFRNNKKSVALIVSVMALTFISLVGTSGILVGLIEGTSIEYRAKFTGDFTVSPLENKKTVVDTDQILAILKNLPEVKAVSARYQESGQVESNYNKRDAGKRREVASMQIVGIDPSEEIAVTGLNKNMLRGDFLENTDTGKIVLGKNTLGEFAEVPQDKERSLGEVEIGDIVLLTIGGKTNEFTIKGILGGKTDVTRQSYISATDLKKITGKADSRASSIHVRAQDPADDVIIKDVLFQNGFGENQKIQTYAESEPAFVKNLKKVFATLGNLIGGISIIVAIITIYIIIYINAVTRRKYIGIMKGIGISPSVIELSYVFQSIFYGVLGSGIGSILIYFVFIPLLNANPIDFPFSDGILVAPLADTLQKFLTLMFFTLLAGYWPARSIVKQNTLNAILGR